MTDKYRLTSLELLKIFTEITGKETRNSQNQ